MIYPGRCHFLESQSLHGLNISKWVQIENEFGFVGPNEKYMRHLLNTARASLGSTAIIYTTDPPPNIAAGTIAGDEVYRYIDAYPSSVPAISSP